ncbi:MAG: ABC transporter ATP-binding protein [Burkholderiales bacterium]|nr:MAG: ABC transporter ATP-binding protein [Burkholderiales bacterium]
MASVRLDALTMHYGTQPVLGPIDLQIDEGEFFTFVGPSGCGKSTLLNLVAGVDAPSGGRIWFGERDVSRLAPGDRDIAMVFQSYALYPHLSVRENIAFPLRVRGLRRAEIPREVERVAATLGLSALLQRRPGQLSGGQRQRVALGRALVRRPAAFLMDEPLSNLDAALRLEMREELKRLHQLHGITTIYVTHDQEEAMALSDRVAVLRAGAIQQCGAPQQVYDDPDNLFVARFLGSPPINLLGAAASRRVCAASGPVGVANVPGVRGLPGVLDVPCAPDVPSPAAPGDSARTPVLGIRPERIAASDEPGPDAVAATTLLTEPTGSALWVVAELDGERIRARAEPGARLARDATVYLRFDLTGICWFDADHGRRLRPSKQA